ncbi:hypothetical protein BESB_028100 [Besnoitia besnoiti]|uniref:Uncharacterized protein n=1 Tax=Besnoitia besnoiti TaxID=94643 RepID=A0A2A9M077_BESBE|nr:uncharacterized protein BESB_028100 [Besnoitia besnoiti]PFH31375.1 hypothetical protein BESB_028100 [Besnoitia besnoiti]
MPTQSGAAGDRGSAIAFYEGFEAQRRDLKTLGGDSRATGGVRAEKPALNCSEAERWRALRQKKAKRGRLAAPRRRSVAKKKANPGSGMVLALFRFLASSGRHQLSLGLVNFIQNLEIGACPVACQRRNRARFSSAQRRQGNLEALAAVTRTLFAARFIWIERAAATPRQCSPLGRPLLSAVLLKMMFPGMMREAPKEYLSPKWRLVLRVAGFVGACILIAKYGDLVDMPENNRLG